MKYSTKKVRYFAWVVTERALAHTAYADRDGMCKGEIKVHINIVMEMVKP
jgi:hypothetical protein